MSILLALIALDMTNYVPVFIDIARRFTRPMLLTLAYDNQSPGHVVSLHLLPRKWNLSIESNHRSEHRSVTKPYRAQSSMVMQAFNTRHRQKESTLRITTQGHDEPKIAKNC